MRWWCPSLTLSLLKLRHFKISTKTHCIYHGSSLRSRIHPNPWVKFLDQITNTLEQKHMSQLLRICLVFWVSNGNRVPSCRIAGAPLGYLRLPFADEGGDSAIWSSEITLHVATDLRCGHVCMKYVYSKPCTSTYVQHACTFIGTLKNGHNLSRLLRISLNVVWKRERSKNGLKLGWWIIIVT